MKSEFPPDSIPVSDAELARLVHRLEHQVNRDNSLLDHDERYEKFFGLVITGTRDGLLDLAAKALKGAVETATYKAKGTSPAPPPIADSASRPEILPTQVQIVRDDDLRRRLEEQAMKPTSTNMPWYVTAPLKSAFCLFFVSAAVGLVTIVRWLIHFVTG